MSDAPALYLSRARLRTDAPIAALRELLVPGPDGDRLAAGHRLVWTLFGDTPDRRRDFLWREAEPGLFYLLSERPPVDVHGLFHIDPPKPFEPVFAPGDRLHFALRVNATVSRASERTGSGARVRGTRHDIVMDALKTVPAGSRAEVRPEVLPRVARSWMARQGDTHGFALDAAGADVADSWESGEAGGALRVAGYRVLRIGRGSRKSHMQIGVLDLEGTLVVRDPERFTTALRQGFGHAKAFGCGLMLVRRARA